MMAHLSRLSRRADQFVSDIFGEDVHVKRVQSLSAAVAGAVHGSVLGVQAIGAALAQARGLEPKHAIKQVDRLLSNGKLDVWELFAAWVPFVVGAQKEIRVALDWTDFDKDGHTTISLALLTGHGRSTPLMWKTVFKDGLKDQRNAFEDQLLVRFREVLPKGVHVILMADRGFGDAKFYTFLASLGFDYVIRFRANIIVEHDGVSRPAGEWVHETGRPRMLKDVLVTTDRVPVPCVVLVHDKDMKDAWCLASSLAEASPRACVTAYGKRFTIETVQTQTAKTSFAWCFTGGFSSFSGAWALRVPHAA